MSEQIEPTQKPKRQFEAKYKYLADFSNEQHSPNRRIHYNNSFSKRSNSQQRRSSIQRSPQKSSFKKSQERKVIKNRHYSPSCSTFNPRRQTTQEQFSPYDERAEKQQDRLSKELLKENDHLRTILVQAGQTIDSLKVEVTKKENQIIQIKKMSQNELRYFEKVVAETTNQIQILLTKNKILENELIGVKIKLQEEYRRQEEYQDDRKRHDLRRKQDIRRQNELNKLQDGRLFDESRRDNPQSALGRSVGKLMNRPLANNQQQESLDTSKIKIQQDSDLVNQSNLENSKPNQNKNLPDKYNRRAEELIGSIKSMQLKIVGQQSTSLRDLWKWLKGIGHSHSCLKRWKTKATEACSHYPSEKLKDIIREACGYIQ